MGGWTDRRSSVQSRPPAPCLSCCASSFYADFLSCRPYKNAQFGSHPNNPPTARTLFRQTRPLLVYDVTASSFLARILLKLGRYLPRSACRWVAASAGRSSRYGISAIVTQGGGQKIRLGEVVSRTRRRAERGRPEHHANHGGPGPPNTCRLPRDSAQGRSTGKRLITTFAHRMSVVVSSP